jgi:hypothetical protein
MHSSDSMSGSRPAQRFHRPPAAAVRGPASRAGAAGRYTDDVSVPQAFAVFVRARTRTRASSRSIPPRARHGGVLACSRAADYVADGHVGMAHFPNPADAVDIRSRASAHAGGKSWTSRGCRSRSTGCATSARRLRWWWRRRSSPRATPPRRVVVEYDVLPAVTDALEALAPGAPTLGRRLPATSRSTTDSATAPQSTPSIAKRAYRRRAAHPLPAHRQRLHGAARGDRKL